MRRGAHTGELIHGIAPDTPIARAVAAGNVHILRCALAFSPAIDDRWLFLASNSLPCTEALLAAGCDVHTSNSCGRAPLHDATRDGNVDVVDRLIDAGANVNACIYCECTTETTAPIHIAVNLGRIDLLRRLVQAGADVDAEDDGLQPIHIAASSGTVDELECLVEADVHAEAYFWNSYGFRPIHMAASGDNAEALEWLVDAGAIINAALADGRTPLHIAACEGNVCAADACIRLGADVHALDEDGLLPLHAALNNKNWCVARRLRRACRPRKRTRKTD